MRNPRSSVTLAALTSTALVATIAGAAFTAGNPTGPPPVVTSFPDRTGQFTNINVNPAGTAPPNPFNQPLGANGRACVTCHRPGYGWTITPFDVQQRFDNTQGTDPIFNTVDGSDSPLDDTSTLADKESAYSMLLSKALIRIGLPMPANAQFTLVAVDDPYGFASAQELSLFRRPLPATNEEFLTAVMDDGRETIPGQTITQDLASQAINAVETHEQGSAPPPSVVSEIVAFEQAQYTAQTQDNVAGSLTANGATGGPAALVTQNFYYGINDFAGGDPTGAAFNPLAMTLYSSWSQASAAAAKALLAPALAPPPPPPAKPPAPPPPPPGATGPGTGTGAGSGTGNGTGSGSSITASEASIARGEAIFNSKTFRITGVKGLNDTLGRPVIVGTCTTCHDTPNVGNHSVTTYMDTGTADAAVATPDLPLYTFQNNTTGALIQTTDPGRALITGQWADIGKFTIPTLRGLPARPPYFHNGMAPDAAAVVAFYDKRFAIGLTTQQQTDLVNFLNSL